MKSKKFVSDRLVKIFSYAFITFVSLACLYPLLMVLGVSFSDNTAVVQHGYKVIPEIFSLDTYVYLFSFLIIVTKVNPSCSTSSSIISKFNFL